MLGLSDVDACIFHGQRSLEEVGRPLPTTEGGWRGFLVAQTARQVVHLLLPRRWRREVDRQTRESFGAAALAALRLAEGVHSRFDPFRLIPTALPPPNPPHP